MSFIEQKKTLQAFQLSIWKLMAIILARVHSFVDINFAISEAILIMELFAFKQDGEVNSMMIFWVKVVDAAYKV